MEYFQRTTCSVRACDPTKIANGQRELLVENATLAHVCLCPSLRASPSIPFHCLGIKGNPHCVFVRVVSDSHSILNVSYVITTSYTHSGVM